MIHRQIMLKKSNIIGKPYNNFWLVVKCSYELFILKWTLSRLALKFLSSPVPNIYQKERKEEKQSKFQGNP